MSQEKNKNLIPFDSNQSREKAKENGRKGGIASGVSKRARKQFKEELEAMLSMKAPEQTVNAIKQMLPKMKTKDITNQALICAALFDQALKGNTKAWELIRDTVGEMPEQTHNIKSSGVVIVTDDEHKKMLEDL